MRGRIVALAFCKGGKSGLLKDTVVGNAHPIALCGGGIVPQRRVLSRK